MNDYRAAHSMRKQADHMSHARTSLENAPSKTATQKSTKTSFAVSYTGAGKPNRRENDHPLETAVRPQMPANTRSPFSELVVQ